MALSKRLRYEVLRRDNYTCRYCGKSAPEVVITVDHVIPKALGGSDEPSNLCAACRDCNGGKTSSSPDAPLVDDVAEDALKWSRAMQTATARMLADLDARETDREQFRKWWNNWAYGEGDDRRTLPLEGGWEQTVDQLVSAGLPLRVLKDCIDRAMSQRKVRDDQKFRYMCGVAWKKLTELQNSARGLGGSAPAGTVALGGGEYDRGRTDLAWEVLGELNETEREQYLDWADDGGYGDAHGSPQTEADKVTLATVSALNDIRCDLACLEQELVETLNGLPGDVGKEALKAARVLLYNELGEGFPRRLFFLDALRHLEDELRLSKAARQMSALSAEQRNEWLRYAATIYPTGRISDAGWVVRAAMCAELIEEGRIYSEMCRGPGEHIKACPERATYCVKVAECVRCTTEPPEGAPEHNGHLFCERHLEQIVAGEYRAREGNLIAAVDFTAISAPTELAPF